jgi:PAS domain S-box-containing protein
MSAPNPSHGDELARNERFQFLVAATPDLVVVLDDDACVRYVGANGVSALSASNAELIGAHFFDFVHPDDRAHLPETAWGFCTNKADGTTHWEVRLKDGAWRWINVAGRDRRTDGIGIVLFIRDVTEKKRADEEAWLLRRAVDAVNNLISITDARADDQPVTFVNEHFLCVTGYDRDEVIGKNCRFLQHRPDGSRDGDQPGRWEIRKAIEEERHAAVLLRNYRKDGTIFWNELYVSPLRNPSGEVTHFVGVQNDVTEREHGRHSVVARERLLRSFYDSAPLMMGVAELDGNEDVRYRFVNRASTEIFDRTPEEVVGRTALELGFTESEAERWASHYQQARETEEPAHFETYFPWDSDPERRGVRTLHVVVNYIGDEDGVHRFSFIADDHTERLRVERARQLLEEAVESTAEPLLITDTDLANPGPHILYANPAFLRMTGYSQEELVGKSPRILQGPKTDRALLKRLRRQLAAGRPFRGETVNYRRDGSEYIVEWEISPIRDEDGNITHWVSTQRDVTERRLLEHQVLDATSRAQERIGLDLHDNLGQLLTGANFLASTLVHQLEEAGRGEAAHASRLCDILQQGIEQARALAHGLHPVDIEATGLVIALERLANSARDVYDAECTLETVPTSATWGEQRTVDLYRIAQEAVTNAIRHGRAKHIRIRVVPAHAGNGEEGSEDDLMLEIEDDGMGISDEDLERGSGMGLHNMRYRARRIGGDLRVLRREGGGTIVRCRFNPQGMPAEFVDYDAAT